MVCKLDRLNAIIHSICVRKGSYTEIRTFVRYKFRLLEKIGQFLLQS